jgi:hypothetical protein
MKVKYTAFAALILTAMTVFLACEKKEIRLLGDTPTGARVKFLPACSNCPSLQMTANGQIINPTGVAYGGAFPSSGYAILPTGEVSLDFIRTDSSKSFFSTKVSLSDGKYYSVYIGDTIPTPTVSLIEDDIKSFQDSFLRVRFVNVLSGKTKDTLDLIRKNDNLVVASAVTYGKASEFKFVPTTTADTFFYRKTGTTAIYPLITNTIFTARRNAQTITFLARGLNNKTTGAQTAKIDWWVNR